MLELRKKYPLLLGTWIIRSTNDNLLSDGISYLVIKNDNSVKLRNLNQEGFIGTKKSITGTITNITKFSNLEYQINLKYSHFNKYSYSLFGVEIPELKSETKNYLINKIFNITLYDNSLLVEDNNSPLYYLYDLHIGDIKRPHIETGINTFFFTQLVSFILNLILAKLIHIIYF
jgi:hypothetical protein